MNVNSRYFDYPDEFNYIPKFSNFSEREWSDYRRFDYAVGVSTSEMEDGTNSTYNKGTNKYASRFLRRMPSRRRVGPWHRSRRHLKKSHQPAFYSDDAFYGPWPVNRRAPIQVYAAELGPPVRPRRSSLAHLQRQPSFLAPGPSSYYVTGHRSRSNPSRIKLAVPQGCRLQLGLRPIDVEVDNKDQSGSPRGMTGGNESTTRRKKGESRRSNSELSVDISVEMEAITKEIDGIMSNNVLDIMMGQNLIDQKLVDLMNSQIPSVDSNPAPGTLTEEQSKLLATDKPPLEELCKIPLAYLKPRPPKLQTINPSALKTKSSSTQTVVCDQRPAEWSREQLYEQLKAEVITCFDSTPAKVTTATNTSHIEGKNSTDTQYNEEDTLETELLDPSNNHAVSKMLERYEEMVSINGVDEDTNWRIQLVNSRAEKDEIGDYQIGRNGISSNLVDFRARTSEIQSQPSNVPSDSTIPQSSSAESRPGVLLTHSKTTMTSDDDRTAEPTCFKLIMESVSADEINKLTEGNFDCGDGDGIPLHRAIGSIALRDKELRPARGKHLNCFTEKRNIIECLCQETKSTIGFCDGGGDSSLAIEHISGNFISEEQRSDEIGTPYLTINDVGDKINNFTTMDTSVIVANLRKMAHALETSTPVIGKEESEVSSELLDALNRRTNTIKRLGNQIETLESLNSLLLTLGVTGYVTELVADKES